MLKSEVNYHTFSRYFLAIRILFLKGLKSIILGSLLLAQLAQAENCVTTDLNTTGTYFGRVQCKLSGGTIASIVSYNPFTASLRKMTNALRCSDEYDTNCSVSLNAPLSISRIYFKNTAAGAVENYYWIQWDGSDFIDSGVVPADITAPSITSITRQTPTTSTTDADTVRWRISFSEAVQNVDVTDFNISGTTANVAVTVINTTQYDVTLSGGDLPELNATISLSFENNQNIQDLTGNDLTNTTPIGANDNNFIVINDTLGPDVQITGAPDSITDLTPFAITIQFSEAVNGFTQSDLSLDNAQADSFIAVDNDTYSASIIPTGSGNIIVGIDAAAAEDTAGNPNSAATSITVSCGFGCNASTTKAVIERSVRNFTAKRLINLASVELNLANMLHPNSMNGGFNGFGNSPIGLNIKGADAEIGTLSTSLNQFIEYQQHNNLSNG